MRSMKINKINILLAWEHWKLPFGICRAENQQEKENKYK